jgi:hypothetical protein
MLAYLQIGENSVDGAPAASRDQIDAIVDNYYAAPSSTVNKRKRKNTGRPQLSQQPNDDQEPRESIVELYEGGRGAKCRILSIPDNDEE